MAEHPYEEVQLLKAKIAELIALFCECDVIEAIEIVNKLEDLIDIKILRKI